MRSLLHYLALKTKPKSLKDFRRIATHYDKTDMSFAAAVHLVAAFLAMR
jgi:hypothetical protein